MLKPLFKPSIAFFETFISVIKNGINSGKLKIAIKVKLLPAFDAMADTIVNADDNPPLPTTKTIKENIFIICFFIFASHLQIK